MSTPRLAIGRMLGSALLGPALLCAALLGPALLGACTTKGTDERCRELADYLDGRQATLERDCLVDDDCEVVFVRPDTPIAATRQPDDPALARVVAEYRDTCRPIPRAEGELVAVCEERVIDIPDPDDPRQTVEESLGRACLLRGSYTVPDVGFDDAGADGGEDAEPDAPCECLLGGCPTGELCQSCVCVPDTLCGRACANADDCGALETLGLGSDPAVCAASCEGSLESNPGVYSGFVTCLRDRDCATIDECGDIVPP